MDRRSQYEVIGVGTPLLDHLLSVSLEYLETIPGEKYGTETVGYEEMIRIIENSGSVPKQIAGGSCANAIKGLACLGHRCALTGKIGRDAIGEKVIADLKDLGVEPLVHYSEKPTAHVVCLITGDGNRTCRSYQGAAEEMSPKDLVQGHFSGVRLAHIEGYTLLRPGLTRRAMELAKKEGAAVSFDLASFEIVRANRPLILELIEEYVDIVFANRDEATALTGHSIEKACEAIKRLCSAAVVMMGEKGCWAIDDKEKFRCPAVKAKAVDTTGAGDLFASGFLHGYLLGKPLNVCAQWGAIAGGAVVEVIGAELSERQWSEVKRRQSLLGGG